MRTFNDNAGRTWSVSINVETARRIRSAAKVDLMELIDSRAAEGKPLLERLLRDPILLCDVLYVACKDEADLKNVSDVDFGRGLYGQAIVAARTALVEEIADFFPEEGPAIRRQAEKLMGAYRRLVQEVDLKIQGYSEDLLVEAALAKMAILERGLLPPTAGTSLTSSPASAESTPPG